MSEGRIHPRDQHIAREANANSSAPQDAERLEYEAIAWFTRMNGRPTARESLDFERWLATGPAQAAAYRAVAQLVSSVGPDTARAAGKYGVDYLGPDDDLSLPLQRIAALRQRKQRQHVGKIAAGGVLSLLIGGWLWLEHPNAWQNLRADYVTARAERAHYLLSDGSGVLLDADSALDVDFTAEERRVHLLRGTAAFTVSPSDIPFIVEAGTGEALVLGTVFDVSLHGDQQVTVTLASGSLQVMTDKGGEVTLSPGESVSYDKAALHPVEAVDLAETTAWHQGRLIFNNAPLAEVLEQIGRYRPGRILLTDKALGGRRVSGNISLENSEAALRAMQASVGFSMTSIAGRMVIISP
ncbi:FecR family protein [Pseudogemmobacter humi]|nr:FecR domain-containing protein [Pseudogemmobacter humi]